MSRLIDEVLAAIPPARPEEPPARAGKRRRRAARPEPRQKCTFELPRSLARELRRLCQQEGVTQREVIERLVSGHVARRRHRLRKRAG